MDTVESVRLIHYLSDQLSVQRGMNTFSLRKITNNCITFRVLIHIENANVKSENTKDVLPLLILHNSTNKTKPRAGIGLQTKFPNLLICFKEQMSD